MNSTAGESGIGSPDSLRYHPGMDEKRKIMARLGWAIFALALPVLYFLGLGPVFWLMQIDGIPESVREVLND